MKDQSRTGTRLRDKWASLSFEKKMTIFGGPLLVAVVAAVLAAALPMFLGADDTRAQDPPETFAKEKLEVLDFFVDGGQRQELTTDPPTTYPTIDTTLRNVGKSVSVVTRAEFEILDFGKLQICEAGGNLTPSANYDVGLPLAPNPGDVLVQKISQALKPNTADRFTFTLNVLPEGQEEGGVFIYRLKLRLYHDGSDEEMPVGTALIAAPYIPYENYFPAGAGLGDPSDLASFAPNDGTVQGCYLANEQTYLQMIGLEGERDPRMTETVVAWP